MPRRKVQNPAPAEVTAVAVVEDPSTLPGEGAADEGLVNQAVDQVNRLYAGKGLETARVIGEYLLTTFFAGDSANFRERGKAHVSFRKLAEREDLYVSYSFLWNAVAVVDQLRQLPPDIAEALPLSHHQALLPLKDEKAKVKLAREAVKKHLDKRTFREEVKKVRAKENPDSRAGRPPLPAFAKAFGQLDKLVKLARTEDVTEASFEHYSREKAQQLLLDTEDKLAALQRLLEKVRAQLAVKAKGGAAEPEVVYEEG